ncbi:MAG TPA: LacI family DNA-binding transcriptional regulator [Clostridiales bacterium]|nr:LacI family DNA-binding transcriptional regulator [Clostridiales bacterium]
MNTKLVDIAKHLNISVSTVSRVINGKDRVSDETREKVLNAIKEFNYQPNEIARSLRSRSSMTIGVILPDISNEFFALLIKGAEAVAKNNGYLVILCNSDYDETMEKEYLNMLAQKQVDGIIVATVCRDGEYFDKILNGSIPAVFVDNLPQVKRNYNFVTIDNEKASYDLTKYLISSGYKDIAIITGKLQETSAIERLDGWKKAMNDSGVKVNNDFIGIGDFKIESGYKTMKKMLELNKKPQALLAANNYIAYGAVKAIREKGLRVPEDVYVVCFDATDETGLMSIRLPSMIQPAEKIGEIALEIIIKRIDNKEFKIYDNVILEPEFVK